MVERSTSSGRLASVDLRRLFDSDQQRSTIDEDNHHDIIPLVEVERFEELLEIGQEKGYVAQNDIEEVYPELGQEEDPDEDLMHDVYTALIRAGIPHEDEDVTFSQIGNDDLVGLYMKEVGNIPLLTAKQEVELAIRIEQGRKARKKMAKVPINPQKIIELQPIVEDSLVASEHLITANSRLVINVAKKYRERGVPFLDLIQEGNIGLIRATKKFKYQRGFKFSTYATWWIRQAVTRAITEQGRTIRVPVHMGDQINRMLRVTHQLTQVLGREPTIEEAAEALHVEPKKVENMMQISRRPISLEEPTDDQEDSFVGDFIEDEDAKLPSEETDKKLLREQLEDALHTLPPREARVMRLRNGMEDGQFYTLEEVGRKMELTRERIRQIEEKALRRLKNPLIKRELVDYLRE